MQEMCKSRKFCPCFFTISKKNKNSQFGLPSDLLDHLVSHTLSLKISDIPDRLYSSVSQNELSIQSLLPVSFLHCLQITQRHSSHHDCRQRAFLPLWLLVFYRPACRTTRHFVYLACTHLPGTLLSPLNHFLRPHCSVWVLLFHTCIFSQASFIPIPGQTSTFR